MASNTFLFFAYAATVVFIPIILLCGQQNQVMAQNCGANLGDIISQCGQYVQKTGPKVAPSRDCCAALTPVNVPCICKYINPQVESMVSMEKVVFIARSCGKSIAPGMKCGSYTAPPS